MSSLSPFCALKTGSISSLKSYLYSSRPSPATVSLCGITHRLFDGGRGRGTDFQPRHRPDWPTLFSPYCIARITTVSHVLVGSADRSDRRFDGSSIIRSTPSPTPAPDSFSPSHA